MLEFEELIEPFPGISMWGADHGGNTFTISRCGDVFWASTTNEKGTLYLGKFIELTDAKLACEAVLTQEWQRTQPA